MSLLNDLLVKVENNLKDKELDEDKINLYLEKIRSKYIDDIIWNPIEKINEKIKKEITREERLEQWEKHYNKISKDSGQIVFENNKKEINKRYEYGRTLLHKAILSRNKKEIKDLISKGIDYNIRDNSGLTPFQIAVIEEDKEIINFLKNLLV